MGTIGSKTNVKKIIIKPEKSKDKQPLCSTSSPNHLPTHSEKVHTKKAVVFEESSLTDTEKLQIRNERSKKAYKYIPSKETSTSREFLLNDDSTGEADKSTTTQPERQELEEVDLDDTGLTDSNVTIDHSKRNCPGKYKIPRTLSMVTQVSPSMSRSKGDQAKHMDNGVSSKTVQDKTSAISGQETKHQRDLGELNVPPTRFRNDLREQLILKGSFDSDLIPFGKRAAGTQQDVLGHFQLAGIIRKPKGAEPSQNPPEAKQQHDVKHQPAAAAADQTRVLLSLRQRTQELDSMSKDKHQNAGPNAIRTVPANGEPSSRDSGGGSSGGGGYRMSTCPPVRAPEQERLPRIDAHQNKEYNSEFMKTWLRERDKKCGKLFGDTKNSVKPSHGADGFLSSVVGRYGSYKPVNTEKVDLALSSDSGFGTYIYGEVGNTGVSGVNAKHKNTTRKVTERTTSTINDNKDDKTVNKNSDLLVTSKAIGDFKNKGETHAALDKSWSSTEFDSDREVSNSSTAREMFKEASKTNHVQIGNLSFASAGRSGYCSVQDDISDRFQVHETFGKGSRGSKNKRDVKGKWKAKFSKQVKYRDDFDCCEFEDDFEYIFNDDDIKRKECVRKLTNVVLNADLL